ncbi:TPA: hypothetical protein DHW62_01230 [candidate division WWE3 bacterium]|uniref:Uncharacterized protein n=1 Tax=candidate division WWE3 bacterium TaxID=2053526 RepID=A0A656PPW6_UNCKA|nr:hypothetical protein P147_WWE3C00001G0019 [candidate division WWE3 bacterium RAAC2_WWE3_1]KKS29068.1 MAG: hypothetical protein UU91_C0009G0002 [candidate division WWE3 bacterium GW2011_GWB1_42_117]KKS55128.1 MAG: hypothetical protein UV21_C0002G0002 [candidate division WWE3 bacterium GW2011_GWD2_42_34]KKT06100.1 MAG: hypothetical protein UV84_C0014G0011 [candidate division WWE3 bacterium GW2011_GWF2_43_18]KKT08189.1 MAG: hypothetical protein UV87_C0006G0017 [candidate division WWE3 bacterium
MDLALMFFWGTVGGITVLAVGKMLSYKLSPNRFVTTLMVGILFTVTALVSLALAIFGGYSVEKPLVYALAFLWIVWIIETFSTSPVVLVKRKKIRAESLMGSEPE